MIRIQILKALGKTGRIAHIDSDGDMRVKVGDNAWIFSPVCLTPVDDASVADSVPQLSGSDHRATGEDAADTMSSDSKLSDRNCLPPPLKKYSVLISNRFFEK